MASDVFDVLFRIHWQFPFEKYTRICLKRDILETRAAWAVG